MFVYEKFILYQKSLTRRYLFIAIPLGALLLFVATAFFLSRVQDLRSRSAPISEGMPREQVVDILGTPDLTLRRSSGKGECLVWTDQFWQVDVLTGPDGRVESIGCMPSDSAYRRTIGRLTGLPK